MFTFTISIVHLSNDHYSCARGRGKGRSHQTTTELPQTRERERERETKQENKQDYHLKMARWREKAKENKVSLLFQHLTPHASCF